MTACNRARERFFVGVNPQMVKEVASFPELFVTPRILAFHDPSDSSCLYVLVSQYFVVCCIRHMFAFTDTVESLCIFQTIFLCYNLANSLSCHHLRLIKLVTQLHLALLHLSRSHVAEVAQARGSTEVL